VKDSTSHFQNFHVNFHKFRKFQLSWLCYQILVYCTRRVLKVARCVHKTQRITLAAPNIRESLRLENTLEALQSIMLVSNSRTRERFHDSVGCIAMVFYLSHNYSSWPNYCVGTSHGNLPHVGNFDDQTTLMQIGIQATLR
jgi:hypothetical protein